MAKRVAVGIIGVGRMGRLHAEHLSTRIPEARPLLETWKTTMPEGVRLGVTLFRSGELRRLRDERASVAEVVNRLAASLARG